MSGHFGEPDGSQFRIKIEFRFPYECKCGYRKQMIVKRMLRPCFESVRQANEFLQDVFGSFDDPTTVKISTAYLYGANAIAENWLEDMQIGWENNEFVDLEKHYDI